MSLTVTAYQSRQIIKYGGISLLIFTLAWSIMIGAIKAYRRANPPYIAPTVRYGVLPEIVFPPKEVKKKQFTQELPNDALPNFEDQAKVYVVYRPTSQFMALEEDKKTAKSFGFVNEPKEIRPGVYEFTNDAANQKLTMNVLDGSFRLEYPYLEDQLLTSNAEAPGKEEATKIAMDFLKSGKKLSSDLENGEIKTSFLKIENNKINEVGTASEANVTRVDIFRQPLEEFEIVGPIPDEASVSVLVSGLDVRSRQVVEVDYRNVTIDRESFSTYPIKSSQEAWQELQAGEYWPASDNADTSTAIRAVKLAYFEPVTLTNYLQPVYVFEGSNEFTAYVRAVTDKYIEKK